MLNYNPYCDLFLTFPIHPQHPRHHHILRHAVAQHALADDAFYFAAEALGYFGAAGIGGYEVYLYFVEAHLVEEVGDECGEAFVDDALALVFLGYPVAYLGAAGRLVPLMHAYAAYNAAIVKYAQRLRALLMRLLHRLPYKLL